MTRKDYVLIANALLANKPLDTDSYTDGRSYHVAVNQWKNDCRSIADKLQSDNDTFSSVTFLEACGFRVLRRF